MKERKNLEHLFQERFENFFEINPPENVWEEIKIKLEEKEDKRRIIPFWWKLSGIAAALIIGLFVINNFNDAKSGDEIITKSEDSKPLKNNNSVSNEVTNAENSVAVSDKNSNLNNHENKIEGDKTIAVSDEINPSNAILKPTATPSPRNNKVFVRTVKSTITVADNNSEKTNRNKQKSTTTLNKNSASDRSIKNNNAVAGNDSDKNKTTSDKISKVQNNKINKSSIAVSPDKQKGENIFYNYKNNNVIIAEKSVEGKILSDKKSNTFDKNKSFSAIKSNEKFTDKKLAEINYDKNANENSILNIGRKNSSDTDNSKIFKSDSDKNTASNSNENKVKLLEENKVDSTKIAVIEPNALEELLKEKEGKIVKKEPKLNRWQVTSNVAPIYFSSTGNDGSALDSKFENNSKSYSTNYSYGVGVNYAVAKKLRVRTGVNSVSFNYDTNDVLFYQSTVTSKIKNVAKNEQGSFIEIQSKNESGVNDPTLTGSGFELNKFESSLNQKLGYIEVPLEMSYTVLDKKFKIEILGGLSTLFLNQNEVYLESSGIKMDIGKATNLNDIHFSGNVGLGFKYGFLKNLEAKVEPVFKYQMNTYTTDTGDFKPYFIGIYSGLTYNF